MAERVVIVDGANVVGSQPDGWWRDRPGAAARLHARLLAAHAAGDDTDTGERSLAADAGRLILVLEGQACRGVPADTSGPLATVHAAGEGDDEIVAQAAHALGAGADVTVVTADRGLRARVLALGADVAGPRSV